MLTLIDNYDSFTFNLVQQIAAITSCPIEVVRNDAFEVDTLLARRPRAIVISPGPGTPSRAGRIVELIRRAGRIPLLGVCLGHQAIGEAFGAKVVRGLTPVHGKVTALTHNGQGLFRGCRQPMRGARYHSLVIDRATIPETLSIDAESAEAEVMAVSHRQRPVYGIQFHSESYGTEEGSRLVANFLTLAGIA